VVIRHEHKSLSRFVKKRFVTNLAERGHSCQTFLSASTLVYRTFPSETGAGSRKRVAAGRNVRAPFDNLQRQKETDPCSPCRDCAVT